MATDLRFLAFTLVGEQFGVELGKVKEVIAHTEATSFPQAPAHFKGVINLRGLVIPIIDLRKKMKMAKADINDETSIIIIDLEPNVIGVIVDSVDCVLALSEDEISPAPVVETGVKTDFIRGVVRKDKKLILLLDIVATLNESDFQAVRTVTEAAEAEKAAA